MVGHGVAGIILAAGRSRRMGTPKPLLDTGGETFLERAIGTTVRAGCDPVLAVVRVGGGEVALARHAGALPIVNEDAASEQIESLRMALRALPDPAVGAAAVLPVDHPLVAAETVAALMARWRAAPERIVRPVHDGTPGHPTLFPRTAWPALMAPQPAGARSVVEGDAHVTEDVAVDDAGVVADIDTPAAYARWVGRP